MDVLTAIHTRRSLGKMLPQPVVEEEILALLEAAVQAPNHFRVRPWRFIVLSGAARERLGQVMADSLQREAPQSTSEQRTAEAAKPLRAPVIIAVAVDLPREERVLLEENICATAAAVQNLLLAAHARGLAGMWRTGPAARDLAVKRFLGLEGTQPLIGFIYLGYPAQQPNQPPRPGAEDRVTWLRD